MTRGTRRLLIMVEHSIGLMRQNANLLHNFYRQIQYVKSFVFNKNMNIVRSIMNLALWHHQNSLFNSLDNLDIQNSSIICVELREKSANR